MNELISKVQRLFTPDKPKRAFVFEYPKNAKQTKLLIEGGWQDDWLRLHVTSWEQPLTEDCTVIKWGYRRYDLIGIWDEKGFQKLNEDKQAIENEFDFNWVITGIQKPATIITEDGRVYHDLTLLNSGDGFNNIRLERFLTGLQENYGTKNPFAEESKLLKEK